MLTEDIMLPVSTQQQQHFIDKTPACWQAASGLHHLIPSAVSQVSGFILSSRSSSSKLNSMRNKPATPSTHTICITITS
jgi:hypothetical protein